MDLHDLANPQLPRRRALGWLAAASGAALWPSPLLPQSATKPLEPEDFGEIGDGRGDAAPAVNTALAELVRRGGGTLRFRSGKTYLLDATVDASAESDEAHRCSIAIPPGARNITFDLNGAVLRQVSDATTFGAAYRLFNDRNVAARAVPLAAPAMRGDASVRLGAALALSPGQACMLLAGNTVRQGYSPIAELLVVSRVEGDRAWFDRPLRKTYRQHGNWPFGLIDASQISSRNIAIVGPGRVINYRRRVGHLLQVLGVRMHNVVCEGRGGMGIRGRDIVVTDCSAQIQANWSKPVYRPHCLGFDTGSSDISVRNFQASGGTNLAYIHLHEGLANVSIQDLTIVNGTHFDPQGEKGAAISILGSSWNISIDRAKVVNNPQGGAIEARESPLVQLGNAGLLLRDLVIEGEFRQRPVVILDKDPVDIDGLDLRTAFGPGGPLLKIQGNPRLANVLER